MDTSEHMGSGTFRAWPNTTMSSDGRHNSVALYSGKNTDAEIYRVGIYGWRKRCLYALILMLIAFIVINLAMTLWIMRVLDFNMDGMGSMKILPNGVRVTGRAEFEQPVTFSRMATSGLKPTDPGGDKPFVFESEAGLSLISRSKKGPAKHSARIVIEDNRVKAFTDNFEILDTYGNPLFYANKDEVGIKVADLHVMAGESGVVFDGAVQTRLLRADTLADALVLESPTRSLNATAARDVEVRSSAGDLRAEALHNVYLDSVQGEIQLNSPNIFVPKVRMAHDSGRGAAREQYQVCLCKENGRLFLAKSGADCRSTSALCKN